MQNVSHCQHGNHAIKLQLTYQQLINLQKTNENFVAETKTKIIWSGCFRFYNLSSLSFWA